MVIHYAARRTIYSTDDKPVCSFEIYLAPNLSYIIIMHVYIAPEPGNPGLRRCTVLVEVVAFHRFAHDLVVLILHRSMSSSSLLVLRNELHRATFLYLQCLSCSREYLVPPICFVCLVYLVVPADSGIVLPLLIVAVVCWRF